MSHDEFDAIRDQGAAGLVVYRGEVIARCANYDTACRIRNTLNSVVKSIATYGTDEPGRLVPYGGSGIEAWTCRVTSPPGERPTRLAGEARLSARETERPAKAG